MLGAAYEITMPRQDFFDFVVCTSLLTYLRHCSDCVSEQKYFKEVSPNLSIATCAQKAFIALSDKVERDDCSRPWIRDCVEAFHKDVFLGWLDAQILGIENSIQKNFPNVRRVGAAAERSLRIASLKSGGQMAGYN